MLTSVAVRPLQCSRVFLGCAVAVATQLYVKHTIVRCVSDLVAASVCVGFSQRWYHHSFCLSARCILCVTGSTKLPAAAALSCRLTMEINIT
jgi:hypothetical protein